ncbi:MAG: hypothetical protein ACLFU2_07360 [Opitutales bacterium]
MVSSPPAASDLWCAIQQRHEEARTLARFGDRRGAQQLLEDSLPSLIRDWSRRSGLPRHLQLLRLRKLLRGDLQTVLQPRVVKPPTPPTSKVPVRATRSGRIPLDNISAMIDALHLEETRVRHASRSTPEALPIAG